MTKRGAAVLAVIVISLGLAYWIGPWLTSAESFVRVRLPGGYAEQNPVAKSQLVDIWNSRQGSARELPVDYLQVGKFESSLILLEETDSAAYKLVYVAMAGDELRYATKVINPPMRQMMMTNRWSLGTYLDWGQVTIASTRSLGWAIAFSAVWLLLTAGVAWTIVKAPSK